MTTLLADPFLADPWFYLAAVPAVILVGLSKGGFGGAVGVVGVPMMALVMSPLQAAAILLPILVVMDLASLWSWRGIYDRDLLWSMLPSMMVGLAIGWIFATQVTPDMIRLIVGVVAIVFTLRWLIQQFGRGSTEAARRNRLLAAFWGTISGFVSFVAHVGGPPFQIYALPLRLDPKVMTGTSVILFAITNAVKLVPYFLLGQFDRTNLVTSAVLMPLAPIATFVGAWLVKRMRPEVFYPFTYITVGLIALKLVWDAGAQLF
jgi:uncharacterized membrane protein YfcA